MESSPPKQSCPPKDPTASPPRRLAGSLFRLLASLKLAVALLVLLAAVLAAATVVESVRGREFAQWYVYRNPWFIGLLALLAVNVFAAALIRFPWKRSQTGFLVAHAGLLVLLAGSIQTFRGGIEGRLAVLEGETADSILLPDRSRITVLWQGPDGARTTRLGFHGGPVSWSEDDVLDFGAADGIGVKVLEYHPHARRQVDWVAAEPGSGVPALKLAVIGSGGVTAGQEWLGGNAFGSETPIEPSRFALLPVSAASMLDDFLDPPGDLPKRGVLSVHHEGEMLRLPVGENLGKKVKLGRSDVRVEIVEYLPNAKPQSGGRFVTASEEPKEPLLEIRVHLADREEPMRQIAFAKKPLLNLDGVHGSRCPVKFWYHHPAVSPAPGAEFLQTPDGKLYARASVDGAYRVRGEVEQGDEIEIGAGFKVALREYLPSARKEISFEPVDTAAGGASLEAAALVETAVAGVTQRTWLQRGDDRFGFARLAAGEGSLLLTFDYEEFPLGFALELVDFRRDYNPGRVGDAGFASVVRLSDETAGADEEQTIAMNRPLSRGKFTFYQSSFQEQPGGKDASVLSVAYDPGRFLKYLGSLMLCAGTFIMFYRKSRLFSQRSVPCDSPSEPSCSR